MLARTSPIPYLAQRPYTLSGFTGAPDTLREMVKAAQGDRGERSLLVRAVVEDIIAGLAPKDYFAEILAVRYWVTAHIRYANDPSHVELVKDPETILTEQMRRGVAIGDCDDIACLIGTMHLCLGRDAQFVAVGFAEAGGLSHVFERVREPRTGAWIICDPVAGSREREMATRVTTWEVWSTDEPPERGPIERV
jgi:hypothetical protein